MCEGHMILYYSLVRFDYTKFHSVPLSVFETINKDPTSPRPHTDYRLSDNLRMGKEKNEKYGPLNSVTTKCIYNDSDNLFLQTTVTNFSNAKEHFSCIVSHR